jgi:hypothetical protein
MRVAVVLVVLAGCNSPIEDCNEARVACWDAWSAYHADLRAETAAQVAALASGSVTPSTAPFSPIRYVERVRDKCRSPAIDLRVEVQEYERVLRGQRRPMRVASAEAALDAASVAVATCTAVDP